MELRKAEQEIDRLKSEWKALRRKKVRYEADTDGEVDLSVLPPWKDLMSKVVDADIFPTLEPANEVAHKEPALHDISNEAAEKHEGDAETSAADEDAGYSEWGMLITGSTAGQKIEETPAVEPSQVHAVLKKAEPTPQDDESDEDCSCPVDALPDDVYFQLQSFLESFESLQPKIKKFTSRLTEVNSIWNFFSGDD